MKRSLFLELVRKDLLLYRNMMLLPLAVGAVALFLITRGGLMFYLGAVATLCVFIIQLIFLVQSGIVMERKERVHQFVLSLPVTGHQYLLAKSSALALAFLVPFVLVGGAALLLIGLHPPGRGFLPFATVVLCYLPMYCAVLLSVTAASRSEAANTGVVIFFNIAINLFIPWLLRIPSVAATIEGSEAVWTPELLWVLSLELAVSVAVPALTLWQQRKRTDYL